MPAAIHNITIEQGATWQWTMLLLDGPKKTDPAFDLTGYTARMQIRPTVESATVLTNLTSSTTSITGGIQITPLEGRIDIEISDSITSAFAFSQAVYDLELQSPQGIVTRLHMGAVHLSLEVTRP